MAALLAGLGLAARAQDTVVLFEDDFSATSIDTARYQPDAPFFEGGVGDIHAEATGGTMKFVGTTTEQWWSGATLRVVSVFNASEAQPLTVSIDRVAEAGVGTASRSALWIMDETQQNYILFADVRGEEGWRYNRKIGEDGDAPTGGGTIITAFDGGSYDDGGLHRMKLVANGQTVRLFLDDVQGAEVKFPFSKVVIHFGSYARANGDTADTTWDNLRIETPPAPKPPPLFQDDFASNSIDPAKYQPETPFFEGGTGDIHAEAGNGVIRFVGTTTEQWWSGSTLRVVPTFNASEAETVTLSIDRVAEAGVGTASRSALWIFDETQTSYVLFADVRGEEGWRYNRKIGEDGDAPTGGGTIITAFDGGSYDDGGLHRMSMVANGSTVKLLLDGTLGAEVKFPFSPVIFHFGSYARANGDTADTTWDNLVIESTGSATVAPSDVSVRVGQLSPPVTVRIPQGVNLQSPVDVRVVSSDPSIAVPEGGTGGALTLTFPAGGANTLTFQARGLAVGGAQFSLEGAVPAAGGLSVAVISDPGVVLQENFSGASIDTSKWVVSEEGFETTGTGDFNVTQTGGNLQIDGLAFEDFWPGASLKTVQSYVATKELNLVFEMDRVSVDPSGSSAVRSGVFITTDDRSQFVFFGQDVGETGWQVNVNPGNPTGSGTAIAAFNDPVDPDLGTRKLKLVADGSTVEVFRDGVSGGKFAFEVTTGIHFEVGAYARSGLSSDYVFAQFDNVRIENVLPCTKVSPSSLNMTLAESGKTATVTVPQLLNDAAALTVTITSRNPAVAVPTGAVGGTLTLTLPPGSAADQAFAVTPVGKGSTVFDISTSPSSCVEGSLAVDVVAVPLVLVEDTFPGTSFDTSKWQLDETPFDTGTFTPESAVTVANGEVVFNVTVQDPLWPGLALLSVNTFDVTQTTPLTFEIDRVKVGFKLVTGTGAEQRTGIWIRDGNGNFVFFNDYLAHDGRNYGWVYNKVTGQADDDAVGVGVNIAAFNGGAFDNRGNHHLRLVANGATVKLYLDDVFGAEVPFPFSQDLQVGFGAYADEAGNAVDGHFDNARILGGEDPNPPQQPATLEVSRNAGNVVISWSGTGALQAADAVTGPYANVAGASSPFTTPTSGGQKFYRVAQ